MKKYLVATVVAGTLLTTSALANNECSHNKTHMSKKHGKMHRHHKKMPLMGTLKKLNLNETQKNQVQNIMKENFDKRKKMSSFFTDGKFDKEGYIKFIKSQRENKLEQKANTMEKVYNILTPEQKEKFLTTLKDKEAKRAQKLRENK